MSQTVYPIGTQNSEKIRKDGYLYIDKTAPIYQLVRTGSYYPPSCPRCFGKSFLLSTLEAYFQGERELFEGLAMERLEKGWEVYSILHLDLNVRYYKDTATLTSILNESLEKWETLYGMEKQDHVLEEHLSYVVEQAYRQTRHRAVILINEYDRPLLQNLHDKDIRDQLRNMLKPSYGVLKTVGGAIRFALLTGVTKSGKINTLSNLNNLMDILMDDRYMKICGITEREIHTCLEGEVRELVRAQGMTCEETCLRLKECYDGYHFVESSIGMYNPFNLPNTFTRRKFGNYWFKTGTPSRLVKLLKHTHCDLYEMANMETDMDVLNGTGSAPINSVSVIYQSDYLVIKDYNPESDIYRPDFLSREVEGGFVKCLLPFYMNVSAPETPLEIGQFVREMRSGDYDASFRCLQSFFADIPYEAIAGQKPERGTELHYRDVLLIVFKLVGLYTQVEYHTSQGRIDLALETDRYIYVMGFKLNGTAEETLHQIEEGQYALPFVSGSRQVFRIGMNFSSVTCNIERRLVEQQSIKYMNWKQTLFWSFLVATIFYYFLFFGVFVFTGQEEIQLFISEWWYIQEFLFQPGGFCVVAGRWIIQYYRWPTSAVVFHTILLVGCGFMVYRISRCFSGKTYLLSLSLLPVLYPVRMSIYGECLVGGAVGVVLMLLVLSVSLKVRRTGSIAEYETAFTLFLRGRAGFLSVYYAFLYTLLALLHYKTPRQRLAVSTCLILALFTYLFSGWLGIPVPLSDEWMPEACLEIQRLPHYYMYHVRTFFTLSIVGVALFARFIPVIDGESKWMDRVALVVCLATVLVSIRFCLPESRYAQRMMLNELSFLARKRQWDTIIDKYRGKQICNYVSLNYLNMSLAHKEKLVDWMFTFDQKGTKSSCADQDQTFYVDRLSSGVHFLIGDASLSESLAIDGFTQARRKGGVRMLQRLMQVYPIRGEMAPVKEYLDLLAAMSFYKDWTCRYATCLVHPELVDKDPELNGKYTPIEKRDRLSLSVLVDSLQSGYNLPNHWISWEYRGYYYLLGKRLGAFGRFLEETPFVKGEPIPRHSQEVGLLLADKNSISLSSYSIQPEIVDRYRKFKQVSGRSVNQVGVPSIYRQSGDTY